MIQFRFLIVKVIVGISLATGFAFGATEDTSGVNVSSTEKSLGRRLLDKTSFSYFAFATGPAVTRFSNYGIDGSTGKDGGAVGTANQFRANVALNDSGLYIGPFITATFQPTVGRALTLTDSGFRVGHTSLIKNSEFSWSADARFLAPISERSIGRDVFMNLQSTHNMQYSPAGSRMTYGIFTSIMKSFLGPNGSKSDLDIYFGPNITYKASETISYTTYFELYPYHDLGDDMATFKSAPFDINPMVNFQVNKVLTLSPGVIYYPSLGTFDSLSYMAYIFAAL